MHDLLLGIPCHLYLNLNDYFDIYILQGLLTNLIPLQSEHSPAELVVQYLLGDW